ncbi:SRPBCC family protein [Kaistia dalseonensis]|uniref:Polyketide cyclase n=1 Tax=Kaistia dalseonensis TaxID=410840 RepID=A0ABU0H1W6_9HYPH|nr:SRPBCC family protein [Kaistia dalseonensis]MCX5493473.1 SRPBCC family protein [Kaistia dalseonensis]MDQ0436032.1 hypothetical protein [Kaistia dalseonensis]
MTTRPVRHVSISIERRPEDVYGFLSDPANFPQWADGLGHSFEPLGGPDWRAVTPMGAMIIRFTPPNAFGVVDHDVIPDDGAPMANPMRVIANGDGSEVMFTLFHRPDMSDEDFERDADWVAKDLRVLKAVLEG